MTEATLWDYKDHLDLDYPEINFNLLGFVGLHLEDIPVTENNPDIVPDLAFDVERRPWVNGAVAERGAHITLLYGLIKPAHEQAAIIEQLLDGIHFSHAYVDNVSIFGHPSDEQTPIVAELTPSPELREANRRLRFLPHVDTYVEFKPHVTLAYVKRDTAKFWRARLDEQYYGKKLHLTQDIDLGEKILA